MTSNDVARYLGVSQSTVSRALRNSSSVTPATKERVVAAAEQLGYVPDLAARMMVTRRSYSVGVVIADFESPIYPRIIEALQSRLLDCGYRMVLIRDPDAAPDPDAVDVLNEAAVDGMIILSARRGSVAVQRVLDRGTPVVVFSRGDVSDDADAVLADDKLGGELAVTHLHDLGHDRIGILTTSRDRSNGRGREDGARAAMFKLGIQAREEAILHLPLTHDEGVRGAQRLLKGVNRPTALFCVTDSFAFAALDAAVGLGFQIPHDLSIVGMDDSGPSQWAFINLTTVHQPVAQMASAAVDRLVERMESPAPSPATKTVFPVELKVRGTTARPPHAVLRPPLRSRV